MTVIANSALPERFPDGRVGGWGRVVLGMWFGRVVGRFGGGDVLLVSRIRVEICFETETETETETDSRADGDSGARQVMAGSSWLGPSMCRFTVRRSSPVMRATAS